MDINNLNHLASIETYNLPGRCSQQHIEQIESIRQIEGGSSISRFSFVKGHRFSSLTSFTHFPLLVDDLSELFCLGQYKDSDGCSIEERVIPAGASWSEDNSMKFRSIMGVGTFNSGIFSFSAASVSSPLTH
ncbi:MAG: hypothetical protein HLUCCA11_02085 [Phormidesmis priestleyi Ana]|uniref:Uncharacterized protein n=1 Tax=Phormidesmis priestleyi Ana TaxID=1666911 RepID=A0A0P8BT70_9CYAN|nr:MAG: hypothetical protein HLUCCA11_02085 [Phormidesmis priestleyi Ana]